MAFPNVPNLPGVPPLPRASLAVVPAVIELLAADVFSFFGGPLFQQWGLFLNGAPAVVAESVVSFEFKKGSSISSFPVEEGGFESYNKVRRPFDVRLRFSTGGTIADRQDLLDSIDAAVDSLDLMDAVTPEMTYESVNPLHYDYRRSAMQGVGLLIVDVFCEQVRVTATSSFTSSAAQGTNTTTSSSSSSGASSASATTTSISNPQSASAAPRISDGTVQPVTPSASQQAAVDSVLAKTMLPF